MIQRSLFIFMITLQAGCSYFFVVDILSSIIDMPIAPISWELREVLEVGAAFGLILGLVLGVILMLRSHREVREAHAKLGRAQSAFADLMDQRFNGWGLTSAERDIALFTIKGLNAAEISALRGTAEGTIKAQLTSIYRKSAVAGRSQLLGVFIEDLMADDLMSQKAD